MDNRGLGAFVRAKREERGWSQTRLAAESGVDRAYLSQIETGVTKLPGADTRRKLAAALGLRHVDLLVVAGELADDEIPGGPPPPVPDTVQEQLAALARMAGDEDAHSALVILRRLMRLPSTPEAGAWVVQATWR